MKLLILMVLSFFLGVSALAQSFSAKADSLQTVLKASDRDTNRVRTLLRLGQSYVFKPGEVAHDLDSALLLSRQAYGLSRSLGDKKGQGLSYLNAAQAYREKGNRLHQKLFAQRAVALLVRYGSKEDLADAYIELAAHYNIEPGLNLNEKIRLYEQATPLLQQPTNKLKLANALNYRGDLYQVRNEYPRSLRDLKQALTLYQSIGYTDLKGLYHLMGYVYAQLSNHVEALRYGLLALKLAEKYNELGPDMATIYLRLSLTYDRLGLYKQTSYYFGKAIQVAQQNKDQNALINIKCSMMQTLYQNHQPVKALRLLQELQVFQPEFDVNDQILSNTYFVLCYNELNQPAKAEPYAQQLLKIEKQFVNRTEELYHVEMMYAGLASYFLLKHRYDKARHYLLLDEQIYKQKHYLRLLAKTYYQLFKIDSSKANYASALRHYQSYNALGDSIQNEKNSQRSQLLEIQYQTQKKEQNIRLLNQRSKLQQADLQKARTIRNFSVIGAILLILLLGMGYNRYRLKQRSNQLLEAKQTEINQTNQSLKTVISEKDHLLAEKEGLLTEKEWLLKEIHHRVKNNLQIITSLLHSQGAYLKDQTAISAIRESQNRVHAMALIHQKLYQSDRLAAIPIANYVTEIVEYLIQSFDRQDTVTTQIDILPLELDVTQAIPLGLIINEAITNSLKYAFPLNQSGTIRIELLKLDCPAYQLTLSDDGVGLPAELNPARSRTLGMSLIRGLSKQIGGTLEISQQNGVQIRLTFAIERIGQQELVKTEGDSV